MRFIKLFSVAIFALTTIVCCKNKDEENTATTVNENPTLVERDSTVLSDDSATVKTAVGVKDEEQNAIQQEEKEEQKMKTDEEKQ